MKRFFNIAAISASLALFMAATAHAQGIDYAVKLVNDPEHGIIYRVVATSVTGTGFMSINITYPKQLEIHADDISVPNPPGAPITFSCTTSPGAATLIVRGGSAANGTQLMQALSQIWFRFKPGESVYTMPSNQKIGITASEARTAVFVDDEGFVHFYEYVQISTAGLTWLQAHNNAITRTYPNPAGGPPLQGYLATITSKEEQHMLFNTIADKAGWLGGTRARLAAGNQPGAEMGTGALGENWGGYSPQYTPSQLAANPANPVTFTGAYNWYWHNGPERYTIDNPAFISVTATPNEKPYKYVAPGTAGAKPLTFYSIPMTYKLANGTWVDGSVPGVFNAFDNKFNDDYKGVPGIDILSGMNIRLPNGVGKTIDVSRNVGACPNNNIIQNKVSGNSSPQTHPAGALIYQTGQSDKLTNDIDLSGYCVKFAWRRPTATAGVLQDRTDLWCDDSFGKNAAENVEGYYIEYGGYPNDPKVWDLVYGNAVEVPLPSGVLIQYRMATMTDGAYDFIPVIGKSKDYDYDGDGGISDGDPYDISALLFSQMLASMGAQHPELEGLYFSGFYMDAAEADRRKATFNAADESLSGWVSSTLKVITFLYERNPCMVFFDANLGEGVVDLSVYVSIDEKLVAYGAPYGPLAYARRDGYVFAGWYTNDLFTGYAVTNQTLVAFPDDHTLYAKWVPAGGYRVWHNVNDGTPGATNALHIADTTWTADNLLPGVTPTHPDENMVFVAWTTDVGGSRVVVTDASQYRDLVAHAGIMDLVLTAQWAVGYKVYYYLAGGSLLEGTLDEKDILDYGGGIDQRHRGIHGVNVLPDVAVQPVKPGYEFLGWRVSDVGNGLRLAGDPIEAAELFFIEAALNDEVRYIQLEAVWRLDEREFTVYYNYNFYMSPSLVHDDTNTPVRLLQNMLVPPPVKGNPPAPEGWVFTGWNTKPDGTGTTVMHNTYYITLDSGNELFIVLYAQWRASTYMVYYDLGASPDATNAVYAPRSVTLNQAGLVDLREGNTPAPPTGYTFNSWRVLENGRPVYETSTFNTLASIVEKENGYITLQAVWSPKGPYNVVFHSVISISGVNPHNNKEGTPYWNDPLPMPSGDDKLVPGTTYNGTYIFVGWNTDPLGAGYQVQVGDTYGRVALKVPQADTVDTLNLYATWIQSTQRLATFDMNGADSPLTIGNKTWATLASSIPVENNPSSFTRAGYDFTGWMVLTNGVEIGLLETLVQDPANVVYNHLGVTAYEVRFRAEWEPLQTFTVIYNSNWNGLGTEGPVTNILNVSWLDTGLDSKIDPVSIHKQGHILQGWAMLTNGQHKVLGTDRYADLAGPGAPSSITLYAIWVASTPYTVHYDLNFETTDTVPSISVAPNDSNLLPSYQRYGYSGAVWYWTDDLGNQITSDDTFAQIVGGLALNEITLIAGWWIPMESIILFDPNQGTGGPVQESAVFDAPMPDISGLDAPVRAGYEFAGYWDTPAAAPNNKLYYHADMSSPVAAWDKTNAVVTLYARWTPLTPQEPLDQWIIIREIHLPDESNNTYTLVWDEAQIEVPEPRVHIFYTTASLDGKNVSWEPLADNDGISVSPFMDNETLINMAFLPANNADSARFFKARVFTEGNPLIETELSAGNKNSISTNGNIVGFNSITIAKPDFLVGVNFEACETGDVYNPSKDDNGVSIQDALPFVTGMTAAQTPDKADYFQVINESGADYYWLYGDEYYGYWVKRDEEPAIPPSTEPTMDTLRLASGLSYRARNPGFVLKLKGQVRTTASVELVMLDAYTLFASPYPASLPFNIALAYTNKNNSGMNPGPSTALADNIQVQGAGHISYDVYYLHNGAVGRITNLDLKNKWVKSTESVATTASLPPAKGAWYKSAGTQPVILTIPRPFKLGGEEEAVTMVVEVSSFTTMAVVYGFPLGIFFDANPFQPLSAEAIAGEEEWMNITSFSVDAEGIADFEVEYNLNNPSPRFFVRAGADLAKISDWPAYEADVLKQETTRSGTQSARLQFNTAEKMKLRGAPDTMFFKVEIK